MRYGFAPIFACLALVVFSPFVRAQQTSAEAGEPAKAKPEQKDSQSQKELTGEAHPADEEQKHAAQKQEQRKRAEQQLKQQERQRMLGIIPAFNASNIQNAAALAPAQKFRLAFKSATDPFTLVFAAVDAGVNQLQDDFHGYGQGVGGYSKRFGASYLDSFNGTMLGNAVLPVVFHQDPRYFRKGTGSVKSRMWYAALSTVRCKGDNGRWQPSYSNLMGNLAAGTISNLYYPQEDRGVGLTFQRALTVSAEGAIGAILLEFWPDISRKFAHRHESKK